MKKIEPQANCILKKNLKRTYSFSCGFKSSSFLSNKIYVFENSILASIKLKMD